MCICGERVEVEGTRCAEALNTAVAMAGTHTACQLENGSSETAQPGGPSLDNPEPRLQFSLAP